MPLVIERLRRAAARTVLRAPTPILHAMAGGAIEVEGKTLDPQLGALLAIQRLLRLDHLETGTVERARRVSEAGLADLDADPRPMAQVIDTHAGSIPIRVYRPRAAAPALIMYLHGGGGVIGSLHGYDTMCRLIADETRCAVASVEYRLAPEHPHPAAVDDAIAAWRWLREAAPRFGADPARLAIAGDSMGGYLSVMIERRERTTPRPRALGLIYPLLDLTLSQPSIDTYADGFLLTKAMMHWFRSSYCPDPAMQRAGSPWFGDVAGSPTTVIATAGFDPLGDEGRAWAARVAQTGAKVIHRDHASLVHGFLALTGTVRAARDAVAEFCADLRGELIERS